MGSEINSEDEDGPETEDSQVNKVSSAFFVAELFQTSCLVSFPLLLEATM